MRNQTPVHRLRGHTLGAASALALVGALALPGAASADVAATSASELGAYRPPTATERLRVARVAGFPGRCLEIRVSDTHERWASWAFRYPLRGSCRTVYRRAVSRQEINGEALTFVRRYSTGWRRVTAVSDCGRPTRVPLSVWRDIGPNACLS